MRRIVFLTLMFTLWLLIFVGGGEVLGTGTLPELLHIPPSSWCLLLLFFFLPVGLGFLVYYGAFMLVGERIPVITAFKAFLFAIFLDNATPTITPAGEFSSAILIKKETGIPYSKIIKCLAVYVTSTALGSAMFFIISDLLALCLGIIDYALFLTILGATLVFTLLATGFLAVLKAERLVKRIYMWLARRFGKIRKLEALERKFREDYSTIIGFTKYGKQIFFLAIVYVLVLILIAAHLQVITVAVGRKVSLPKCMFALTAGNLLGLITLVPGGVGGTELGMGSLLVSEVGIGKGSAVVMVFRFFHLWLISFLGFLAGLKVKEVQKEEYGRYVEEIEVE